MYMHTAALYTPVRSSQHSQWMGKPESSLHPLQGDQDQLDHGRPTNDAEAPQYWTPAHVRQTSDSSQLLHEPLSSPFSSAYHMPRHATISPSCTSSGLSLSRSGSTASLTSLGASSLVRVGRASPASVGSSPAELVSSHYSQDTIGVQGGGQSNGITHAHRRSFSASYTSSPLSSDSGGWISNKSQVHTPTGTDGRFMGSIPTAMSGQSRLGLHPSGRTGAFRRSVTFSSFSALAVSSPSASDHQPIYSNSPMSSSPRLVSSGLDLPTFHRGSNRPDTQGVQNMPGSESDEYRQGPAEVTTIPNSSSAYGQPSLASASRRDLSMEGHHRARSMSELSVLMHKHTTNSLNHFSGDLSQNTSTSLPPPPPSYPLSVPSVGTVSLP